MRRAIRTTPKSKSHANRGAHLERLVDMTNMQYRRQHKADIRKVPTPIKIMSVKGNRVNGVKQKAEWVDYVGIYEGQTIIFDAKETALESFPLKNIHKHQYELLQSWHSQDAKSFILISFSKKQYETFLLWFSDLYWWWNRAEKGARKSIPYAWIKEQCRQVKSKDGYVLDYLDSLKG